MLTTPPWCLKLFSLWNFSWDLSIQGPEGLSGSPAASTLIRPPGSSWLQPHGTSVFDCCLPPSPQNQLPRHALHSPHTLSSLPENSSQFVILRSLFDQGRSLPLSQEIWGGSNLWTGFRSHMPQLKIPHAAAKTRHSQINIKNKKPLHLAI